MADIPSTPIPVVPAEASSQRNWPITAAAIAFGSLCLGFIFFPEISAAVEVWLTSDAYTHCFLVLPVVAYLAWERRTAAAATTLRPTPYVALPAILIAAAWFMADRLGIMEARQLMAMTLFQVMLVSLLGFQTWRALSAPLLYLFFLVPFGEFVVTPLQDLAVHFTTASLSLLGVSNFSDGIMIEIPEGTFLVHEACSGLRFLIASAAFGTLFALLMFTSLFRRVSFIVLSLAVAILGNCLRVVGIILIAHFIGNAQAAETGHVLWGWLFYLLIGSILILIGLAFRQEIRLSRPPEVLPTSGGLLAPLVVALVAMVLVAMIPAMAASYLDHDTGAGEMTQLGAPSLPGCTTTFTRSSTQAVLLADDGLRRLGPPLARAYKCDDENFVLTVRRYPPRIGVRPLFKSMQALATPAYTTDVIRRTGDIPIGNGPEASVWRVAELTTENGYAAVASALWLNGKPSGTGIKARLTQALNTVRSSAISPVLATVTYTGARSIENAERAIHEFLARSGPLSELISKSVSAR